MLAIIIPFFKLTFFEATLQSLSNQTDKRFKVYIGDDNSPENPINLLEKYSDKFNFVYHKFKENVGSLSLVKQWDRCIALAAEEEWIMILGDDDIIDTSLVFNFHKNYNLFNGKSNLVRFASKLFFEDLNTETAVYKHPVWETATESFYRKFKKNSRSSLSEHIFSKIIYLKYRFYDFPLAWNSDDKAWLDFSDNKPIFTINESVVSVRMSSLNISGRNDNNILKNSSQIEFYKFLIKFRIKSFDKNQKLEIIRSFVLELKKFKKLSLNDFIFIIQYCLKYFNLKFLVLTIRIFFNKFQKLWTI
jgi:hypothetical protein